MNDEKTSLDIYLESAMEKAMADPMIRVLLWHIICNGLHVFEPGYNHNASAYSLLAKKEAGLQILSWMKQVSPQGVYLAESEYNNLTDEQGGGDNG